MNIPANVTAHLLYWFMGSLAAAAVFASVFGVSLLTGPGSATNDFEPLTTALIHTIFMFVIVLPWSFGAGVLSALAAWVTRDSTSVVAFSTVFLTTAPTPVVGLWLATNGYGLTSHHQFLFSVTTTFLIAATWAFLQHLVVSKRTEPARSS
ncbi:hypothetical protein ACX80W_04615 [Arthrobacter sp. TMN-37]